MLPEKTKAQSNVDRHLDLEARKELEETQRLASVKPSYLKRCSEYLFARVLELYWTVTRLLGFAYWHDGSKDKQGEQREQDGQFVKRGQALLNFLLAESPPVRAGASVALEHKLLIDMSQTLDIENKTGIQRLVWEVSKAALRHGGVPVIVKGDQLFGFVGEPTKLTEIETAKGDVFLIAGSWLGYPLELQAVMEKVSASGGSNIAILCDLIPFFYPSLCSPNADRFIAWFDRILLRCDAIICISESVANDLINFIASQRLPFKEHLQIGWQALGADFSVAAGDNTREISPQINTICSNKTPFFLSVSTLEPRKGYSVALDAIESLWKDGADVRYVIVGRYGWRCNALAQRIVAHPQYGRCLFWLKSASDADLRHLYKQAHSLIFPSIAEGFGLALIEAAHHGLPAIASDIPVFREIGGDSIRYFDVADSDMLALRARESLAAPKSAPSIPFLTWQESTESLLAMIEKGSYQFGELRKRAAVV
jgi:glycosyltransferase involved in cell wall biosynthesis